MDEELSLVNLNNIAADAKFLSVSVQQSLDKEWIVQDVHGIIGVEVERLYVKFREEGINDVSMMVLEIGGYLADRKKFDMGDAFVSGWDVANMVGDLLLVRIANGEGPQSGFSDVVVIDEN